MGPGGGGLPGYRGFRDEDRRYTHAHCTYIYIYIHVCANTDKYMKKHLKKQYIYIYTHKSFDLRG